MRFDSEGIFWTDVEKVRGRDKVARVMPPIPDTGWEMLRDLPNLANAQTLSVDLETNDESLENDMGPGWARGIGSIAGISIGADSDGRWYFPIRHTIEPENNYSPERVLSWLAAELGRKSQPKVGANLLYDIGWLRQEGVAVVGELYDVQFAEALLDSDAFVALEHLARRYLGETKDDPLLFQWCADYYGGLANASQRRNLWRSPARLVAPYAIGDADKPLRILEKQWPLLEKAGLLNLFKMECELIPLLIAMRFAGVPVDINRAEQARDYLATMERDYAARIREMVGFDVNVNAGESLAKAWNKLGIPIVNTAPTEKKPEGQPSFTKEILRDVKHPIGQLVRDFKNATKTRSTFIESYILDSHVQGKIYPTLHPLKGDENGTVTGRFSMSNPNGQNLSAKDEIMAPLVRGCFIPDSGHKQWRKYDWSQLQYRFLAHYAVGAGADNLRHIFNTNPKADYHDSVQSLIKQITEQELPRKIVKNINFGFVFGMGIEHLAEILGLTLPQAKELAETYHLGVPYVKETLNAASAEAQEFGVIRTILGRKTTFNQWEPTRWRGRNAERLPALTYQEAIRQYGSVKRAFTHKALNYKLQGSEGDLMKFCMLRAWKEGVFAATGVPRLTVHDELDFSDHGESDDAYEYLHHEIMEKSIPFKVPISVGCDVGASWGDCL